MSLRVVTNSASDELIRQFGRLNAEQTRLQRQVSTGQRVFNPEDDPAAVRRVLDLGGEQEQVRQFARNAGRALDLSQSGYAAADHLRQASDRAGELLTLGSSGTTSAETFDAYAAEVNGLLEEAVGAGNTKFDGDYLFGGTQTDAAPFALTRAATGRITAVAYQGATTGGAAIPVGPDGATVSPYADGASNAKFARLFNRLVGLRDALAAHDPSAVAAWRDGLNDSDADVQATLGTMGTTQARLQTIQDRLQTRFSDLGEMVSDEAGADLASSVVRLTQARNAYQAALQSGAQLLNLSLMDYLR